MQQRAQGEQASMQDHGRIIRKRIKRACDKCNVSRTRCNGICPCQRCTEMGYLCEYTRAAKRRGRKHTTESSPEPIASTPSYTSPHEADHANIHLSADQESQSRNMQPHLIQHVESTRSPHAVHMHEAPPEDAILQSPPTNHSDYVHVMNNCEEFAPTPCGSTPSSLQRPSPHLHDHRPPNHTTYVPYNARAAPAPASSDGPFSTADDHLYAECQYRCLVPILPLLRGVVDSRLACQLLEFYFRPSGETPLSCASPYVLTQVIRRRSLLHPSRPRSTSPALLLTMLWTSAQTADFSPLCIPGRRQWISSRLQKLALLWMYISDLHDQHEDDGQGSACARCLDRMQKTSLTLENPADMLQSIQSSFDDSRRRSIDDVLTFTLFAIVISAGELKADCRVWWNRAVRTARILNLNQEMPQDPSTNLQRSSQWTDSAMTGTSSTTSIFEQREERRRMFWLLFCLDRHLSLSHNNPLTILDSDCQVYQPLPDSVWENLEGCSPEQIHPEQSMSPPVVVTGTGFFEFFLPLMNLLGSIIQIHHLRMQSRFASLDLQPLTQHIEEDLKQCLRSVEKLTQRPGIQRSDSYASTRQQADEALLTRHRSREGHVIGNGTEYQARLVSLYCTFILHVLFVLLHGKWDAISMLDNNDDWIGSPGYFSCTTHAIEGSEAISRILQSDPELTFMPYLFGIYLLHESFIILLFADRMPQVGPNESVSRSCETIIRAHEISVVTLSTEFQRRFRKVLRSTLFSVADTYLPNRMEKDSKRAALMMYRWVGGGRGLGL